MGCKGCAYWDEPDSETCDGCLDKDFDKVKPPPEPSAEELRGLINEILPVGDIADGLAPYYIESDTIHRMRKALEGKE